MCTCSWLWGVGEPPAWAPEAREPAAGRRAKAGFFIHGTSPSLFWQRIHRDLSCTHRMFIKLYMCQIYAPPRTRGPAPAHTIEVNLCTFSENNAAPHHPRSAAELAPALTILLWLYCFKYNVAPLPLPNDLLHLAPPMGPVARTQHTQQNPSFGCPLPPATPHLGRRPYELSWETVSVEP